MGYENALTGADGDYVMLHGRLSHDQHLITLNRADTAAWAAGSWKAITHTTLPDRAGEIGRRVNEIAVQGITEIIYQPTGPDITGELEAFHTAAHNAVSVGAQGNPGHEREP